MALPGPGKGHAGTEKSPRTGSYGRIFIMKMDKMLTTIIKGIHATVRAFTWIGACAAAAMVIVIIINVIGRFLFRQPLHGTIELVELMTVVVVFSVLAYTELRRGHVHVDLVVSRFHRRAKAIVASIMCFAGTAFFIAMAWKAGELMWANLFPSIRETDTLSIPFAPFVFVMAIGSLLLGLEMLINGFHPMPPEGDQEGSK